MAVKVSLPHRILNTFAAVRTGIILLIIVGLAAAAGTFILQSPPTAPEEMQRAYSPQTLYWLNRLGLTDVFHTWWFALLLGLVSISIVLASLERFPNVWRYFARPYRRPDSHFRAVLPNRKQIPIADAATGLDAAERAFSTLGLKSQRVVEHDEVSLYAERSRFSVLGAYVVHLALLLVMGGYIVDSIVGYSGYLQLIAGRPGKNEIAMQSGPRKLGFAVRCDSARRENYPDGTPKQWWSKLTVLENGREVMTKQISVNDPLIYKGLHFYQSGFDDSGDLQNMRLAVVTQGTIQPQRVDLALAGSGTISDGAVVKLIQFIPDAYPMDGGIYQRSRELGAAAAQLQITKDGKSRDVWLFRTDQAQPGTVALEGPYDNAGAEVKDLPYRFVAMLDLAPVTGLQVSYHPGQAGVWIGIIVMAVGLAMVFYFVHMRFWALPVKDEKGALVLWVGGAANKNRERFEERFRALIAAIEGELKQQKARSAVVG